jgi:acyl carrier protein
MTQTADDPSVVWNLLWKSLGEGSYDLDGLRAQATEASHFVEDLHIDSLDLVEFYLRVQDHFHVDFAGDDYPKLTSVAALMAALRAQTETGTPR